MCRIDQYISFLSNNNKSWSLLIYWQYYSDRSREKRGNPSGDYNDLKKLVGDIKNGDFNDDQIPLNDFKNSVAYQDADENMQDCINLAGKIGHNLGETEVQKSVVNSLYIIDKYLNVNISKSKILPPESKAGTGL